MPVTPSQPQQATVRGVEIFAAGTHRDKQYTEADLDAIVRNFSVCKGTLSPSVVIGHEEHQELLENTGIPAVGWVERVWRKGATLFADIARVPISIARLINGRAYRHVSAEVYDEPPPECQGKAQGKMLRRVALLGGELPQIKTLADLPLAEYSERPARPASLKVVSVTHRPRAGSFQIFSEVNPMDRAQLVEMLLGLGYSQELLDMIKDDAALGKLLMEAQAMKGGAPAPAPEPPAEGQMCDDPEKQKMSDGTAGTTQVAAPAQAQQQGGAPKVITMKYSEIQEVIKPLIDAAVKKADAQLAAVREQTDQLLANQKRANIEAFCEAQLKEGKILPSEIEGGLVNRLMRADARDPVMKFSEKGKEVVKTELDLQLDEIKKRPVLLSFAERMKQPSGAKTLDHEKSQVEAHYEKFSEQFRKHGTSKESLVKAYEAQKKAQPGLTAEAFLEV